MTVAGQFRITRLQVYNWGTFSELHDVPIAERGFLFVGRSGRERRPCSMRSQHCLCRPSGLTLMQRPERGNGTTGPKPSELCARRLGRTAG